MIAAYLDADASALADREHTNTHTNTNRPHLVRAPLPLTDSHLNEVEYAASMFKRGCGEFSAELTHLRGLDVPIDWEAVDRACTTILMAAVVLHIRALRERERRAV